MSFLHGINVKFAVTIAVVAVVGAGIGAGCVYGIMKPPADYMHSQITELRDENETLQNSFDAISQSYDEVDEKLKLYTDAPSERPDMYRACQELFSDGTFQTDIGTIEHVFTDQNTYQELVDAAATNVVENINAAYPYADPTMKKTLSSLNEMPLSIRYYMDGMGYGDAQFDHKQYLADYAYVLSACDASGYDVLG